MVLYLCYLHILNSSLIAGTAFNTDVNTWSTLLFDFFYDWMYPYLSYMANKNSLEENPRLISIILGIIYGGLAFAPALIVEAIFT